MEPPGQKEKVGQLAGSGEVEFAGQKKPGGAAQGAQAAAAANE